MTHYNRVLRATAGTSALLGVWLFVSPWVFGAYTDPDAWNTWVIGAFLAISAAIRCSMPDGSKFLSWINIVLGLWIFFSPWMYSYTDDSARFFNSVLVGAVVVALSVYGVTAHTVRGGLDDHLHRA